MGVRSALADLYARRGTSGTGTTGPRWLATPGGSRAPLYITEFGYLNLPTAFDKNTTAGRTRWKTEAQRVSLFTDQAGPHTGAIYVAKVADAKRLTIHTLSESGSATDASGNPYPPVEGRPDYRSSFDTGLIAPVWQADWSDVTPIASATDPHYGWRPYGKGPKTAAAVAGNGPYLTDVAQPRRAYCAIYQELKAEHFPAQPTGVPCP